VASGVIATTVSTAAEYLGQCKNVVVRFAGAEFALVGVVLGTVTDINSGTPVLQAVVTNGIAGTAAFIGGDVLGVGTSVCICTAGLVSTPVWGSTIAGAVSLAADMAIYKYTYNVTNTFYPVAEGLIYSCGKIIEGLSGASWKIGEGLSDTLQACIVLFLLLSALHQALL
jgi:hypothetical protein